MYLVENLILTASYEFHYDDFIIVTSPSLLYLEHSPPVGAVG